MGIAEGLPVVFRGLGLFLQKIQFAGGGIGGDLAVPIVFFVSFQPQAQFLAFGFIQTRNSLLDLGYRAHDKILRQ